MGGRKHKRSGKRKQKKRMALQWRHQLKSHALGSEQALRSQIMIFAQFFDQVMEKLAKKRLTPSQSGVMRIFASSNMASSKPLLKGRPNISSQDIEDRFAKLCISSLSQSCPDFHGIGQMNNDNNTSIIGSNTMKEYENCIRSLRKHSIM